MPLPTVKRLVGAIGWYVAINVVAVGPSSVLAWIWSNATGGGCCERLPATLGLIGVAWGSLALLALAIPLFQCSGSSWLWATALIVWLRMWGTFTPSLMSDDGAKPAAVLSLMRLADGPLRVFAILLLVGYMTLSDRDVKRILRKILLRIRTGGAGLYYC